MEALEEQAALAWPGGFVLGGLAPGQVLWWNALRKPLGMGLRLGPRLATAWAVAHGLAAMGLALSCRSGGVVHQARGPTRCAPPFLPASSAGPAMLVWPLMAAQPQPCHPGRRGWLAPGHVCPCMHVCLSMWM